MEKEKGIRRPVRSLPPELVGSTHRKGPVGAGPDVRQNNRRRRRRSGLEAKNQFP